MVEDDGLLEEDDGECWLADRKARGRWGVAKLPSP